MVSLKHETNKSQQESQRGAAWYKLSSCMWHPHKIYVVLSETFGCPSTEVVFLSVNPKTDFRSKNGFRVPFGKIQIRIFDLVNPLKIA